MYLAPCVLPRYLAGKSVIARGEAIRTVQIRAGTGNFSLIDSCHDTPYSPLRRMPEVPHSISGWFQSIPQRVVPDARCCRLLGRMDPVLFLRWATHFQSMERERVEAICGLPSMNKRAAHLRREGRGIISAGLSRSWRVRFCVAEGGVASNLGCFSRIYQSSQRTVFAMTTLPTLGLGI